VLAGIELTVRRLSQLIVLLFLKVMAGVSLGIQFFQLNVAFIFYVSDRKVACLHKIGLKQGWVCSRTSKVLLFYGRSILILIGTWYLFCWKWRTGIISLDLWFVLFILYNLLVLLLYVLDYGLHVLRNVRLSLFLFLR